MITSKVKSHIGSTLTNGSLVWYIHVCLFTSQSSGCGLDMHESSAKFCSIYEELTCKDKSPFQYSCRSFHINKWKNMFVFHFQKCFFFVLAITFTHLSILKVRCPVKRCNKIVLFSKVWKMQNKKNNTHNLS